MQIRCSCEKKKEKCRLQGLREEPVSVWCVRCGSGLLSSEKLLWERYGVVGMLEKSEPCSLGERGDVPRCGGVYARQGGGREMLAANTICLPQPGKKFKKN